MTASVSSALERWIAYLRMSSRYGWPNNPDRYSSISVINPLPNPPTNQLANSRRRPLQATHRAADQHRAHPATLRHVDHLLLRGAAQHGQAVLRRREAHHRVERP